MPTTQFGGSAINQRTILNHPVGLFILFFTEMWERFSYYGMRAILVLYLTSEIASGGWEWSRADALKLYAWYTGLVYLTPLLGGYLADTKLGYRYALAIGALIMTLGHASLAMETDVTFFLGLALLVIGNGFFKPNMTSIISQMYPADSPLKDSAYTIFYMGVNAGAFLGIAICGYLGENVSWSYGFGAAGVFMFFGLMQFWFGQEIFGKIGLAPTKSEVEERTDELEEDESLNGKKETETIVPFRQDDKTWLSLSGIFLIGTIIASIYSEEILAFFTGAFGVANVSELFVAVFPGILAIPFLAVILTFVIRRLRKYPVVERDRLTVIAVLSFFIVFFWLAFEQAGGSMTIFAADYTDRALESTVSVGIFRVVSLALTFIPMLILTWVLGRLAMKIVKEYPLTIVFTAISFLVIWGIIVWINVKNFNADSLEVPASWFSFLNSFFIISLGPLFSSLWMYLNKTGKNPSGPVKFATGLALLGVGFLALVIGASGIPAGAKTASVSMIWLVLAYFFHTVGELTISPVGLSYVSKLSPVRLVGLMFGIFYLANFVANFLGGMIGSFMDRISETSSMASFFSIFVISSFAAAALLLLLNKPLKRMMHGIH